MNSESARSAHIELSLIFMFTGLAQDRGFYSFLQTENIKPIFGQLDVKDKNQKPSFTRIDLESELQEAGLTWEYDSQKCAYYKNRILHFTSAIVLDLGKGQ